MIRRFENTEKEKTKNYITEGDWKLVCDGKIIYVTSEKSSSLDICDLYHVGDDGIYGKENARANGRLISQAPKLLKSLEEAIVLLQYHSQDPIVSRKIDEFKFLIGEATLPERPEKSIEI